MISYIYIILVIILLVLGFFIIRRIIKKRKAKKELLDEKLNAVMEDFNKAENMFSNSRGELNQQEIIWKVYNDKKLNPRAEEIKSETPYQKSINKPKLDLKKVFKKKQNW